MESIKMLLESKQGWLTTSLEVAIEGGEKMQIYGFVILPESLQEDFILDLLQMNNLSWVKLRFKAIEYCLISMERFIDYQYLIE